MNLISLGIVCHHVISNEHVSVVTTHINPCLIIEHLLIFNHKNVSPLWKKNLWVGVWGDQFHLAVLFHPSLRHHAVGFCTHQTEPHTPCTERCWFCLLRYYTLLHFYSSSAAMLYLVKSLWDTVRYRFVLGLFFFPSDRAFASRGHAWCTFTTNQTTQPKGTQFLSSRVPTYLSVAMRCCWFGKVKDQILRFVGCYDGRGGD